MTVNKLDGTVEQVAVRQLNLRQLKKYLENENDLAFVAELFCGKKEGWADGVKLESALAVVAEGRRLNADFLAVLLSFGKDQESWVKTVAEKVERKTSPDSSPASASEPE